MKDANLLQFAGKIGLFSQDHRQPKCRATTRGQTAVACPMLASSQIGGAATVFHLLTSVCIPIRAAHHKTSGGKPESEKLAI